MSKTIKLPFYGMRHDGRTLFVINAKDERGFYMEAPTYISTLSNLSIEYGYAVGNNTYLATDFIEISRKEFLQKVKEIKEKYQVQITIKY